MFISFFNLSLNAQSFEWVAHMGAPSNQIGSAITCDINGDIYAAGTFKGVVDFDPKIGVYNLTGAAFYGDIFIQKLDANMNLQWAKRIGGFRQSVHSITNDPNGDIYISGYFQGTVDFDPGIGIANLISLGGGNHFILKLDPNGNFLWVKQSQVYNNSLAISSDINGNIHTIRNVGSDLSVQKLDGYGNILWNKEFPILTTIGNSFKARDIGTDIYGNVYVTGYFRGTVDFDPGVGTTSLTSGINDIFILKLDANGNFLLAKQINGKIWSNNANYRDEGYSITADKSGNIYVTGTFLGTVDFDPGIGIANLTSSGYTDIFNLKLDVNGNFLWVNKMGMSSFDVSQSIVTDDNENIYICGTEGSDMFVQKMDPIGNVLWKKQPTGRSDGSSLTLDLIGNIYTIGTVQNTTDMDPGTGTTNITSSGLYDCFIQKLSQCSPSKTNVIHACNSYTWIDGITYTTNNNTATYNLIDSMNCDSTTITLDLTINNSDTIIDTISACNSYTWIDGITYYQNNITAIKTYSTTLGCDSVVKLNLTINNTTTGTDTITECDSLTWIDGNTYYANNNSTTFNIVGGAANSCDSLVTLDLTISSSTTGIDTRTECDSLTWIDGNTYYANNNSATFNIVGGAANSCDSLVTLDLTINTINLSVTQTGTLLTADESGASYQWLNCLAMTPISGAVNQSYTATTNGDYAVTITKNGCSDTSVCYSVTGVSIIENNFENGPLLYPNPTDGNFSIDLGKNYQNLTITITDVRGKLIQSNTYTKSQLLNLKLEEPAGIYFLNIESGNKNAVIRLLKE